MRWAHTEAVPAMEPLSVYLTVDDRVDVVHCHKGWTMEQVRDPSLLLCSSRRRPQYKMCRASANTLRPSPSP